MRISPALVVIYIFTHSCTTKTDTADSELHPDFLEGKFVIGDSTIRQFDLRGCFCNITDSGIKITNTNNGFEGQELVTTVTPNDTILFFSTWTCVGRPPEYSVKKHTLTLDNSVFSPEDSLTGKMLVEGMFNENEKKIHFKIAGHFKCKLTDSLYNFQTYQADLIRIMNRQKLENLKELSKSNPDSVLEIELGGHELKEIPSEIKAFKKLRKLTINQNLIATIDIDLLSQFDSLKELDISENPMSQIPGDIGRLKGLEVLKVSGCKVKDLPKTLFELKRLKILDLSATTLTSVPADIRNLENLEVLDMGYSYVWNVPKEIFSLCKLKTLSLSDSVELFKLNGANLTILKKLDAPYELLEFNKVGLQRLGNLEDLWVFFSYQDNQEEQRKHNRRMHLLGKLCLK